MERNGSQKVVVVGGGLGGLSAAAGLAAEGFRVELHEKNQRLGGKLNELHLGGFKLDLGPSMIILPQFFRLIFERAGRKLEDYLQFEEVVPQWRSFWEDGTVVDLHADMALMEKELSRFGDDAQGYWSFMEYSRMLWRFAERHYLENGADGLADVMSGLKFHKVFKEADLLASMDAGVARHVKEPHLLQMLDFFIKYVGSSAYDSPAFMNLLPYSQLGYGVWYITGGLYNLARGLKRLLEELGVEIHLNSEVVSIGHQGKKVVSVETADGKTHPADIVVSNMEVLPVYQRLTGDGNRLRVKAYENLFEPACSGLVVHLCVKGHYEQARHHMFVFSKDSKEHWAAVHHRKELPEDPTLYVVCPTVTNPELAPEGHSIIKLLPHIPYSQDPPFSADQYEALKQRIYDKMERVGFVGLRDRIVHEHVLTPEDLQKMYYSTKGAIYGTVVNRKKNFALKAPKQSALYDNLFFVGGSTNPGGGTCMVVLSGQKVTDMIVEKYK